MPAVTLFVRKLPATATSEHLGEVFSEVGPLKNCFVVKDKESGKCRGFGYVTFAMGEDAQRALKEVRQYDGLKIFVDVAKRKPDEKKMAKAKRKEAAEGTKSPKVPKEPAETKSPLKSVGMRKTKLRARLIIRNLSFKCTEDDLKQIFSEFGAVLETKIPLKPDGKMRGFAFVQFKNMLQAAKALMATNMKEIKGRPVAVDWAISKDKYTAAQQASASGVKKEVESEVAVVDGKKHAKNTFVPKQEEYDSESEEEGDEDESASNEEDDANNDSESQQTDSDASEDEDEDDDDSEGESDASPKKKNPLPSDVNEGRTVFIRNVSFDSDSEGLEKALLNFGEIKYVQVVMNADTGHSKGCAFAQFKMKEAADKCIAASQDEKESGGIRVDGRRLNISAAVSREDAVRFKDKKVKIHTGSRNLYLAREGLVRPQSKAAEGVSESDMAKRTRFEEMKREKLKDMNVYVSQTRLCVHNLPKSVTQPKLRKICISAAGDKTARITECRVMYDKKPVKGQVMGHSLGYGFVEFKEHEHALKVLRHLNNNPDICGPQKRPIVEFSLEDGRKLKLKAMRLQNSKKQLKKGQPPQSVVQSQGPVRKGNTVNVAKQEKAHGSQYTGFMTKPEVEHVELQDGKKRQKVLHMPSHRGPKIRKRDKGKQPVQPKKLKKGPTRRDRNMSTILEKPSQNKKQNAKPAKRNFRNREDDRFDSLVAQYKKKLMGNSNNKTAVKKNKWFS
ncbi:RNA-binding protein 28 [Xyrauchen texanus]|uniref:RNA-binding protein 28 n=1 Tax=Xyrauchen texanus TaxID=154827 RepID=UPI002241CA30|nr:RNA-binding protein 28 [Xyrauchen texanus]